MRAAPESSWPVDAVAAVAHPDPSAYYNALAARSMHRDERLGTWVVASATDVAAVLASPATKVRPFGEPVPRHLVGTAAGDVFTRLARMTDGSHHQRLRPAIDAVLAALAPVDVASACADATEEMSAATHGRGDVEIVERWMIGFPATALARMLGIPADDLGALVAAASSIAACFAPGALASPSDAGDDAATTLTQLATRGVERGTGIVSLALSALGAGDLDDATANVAGLFFQTFDATAGLIGGAIGRLAVARWPGEPDDDAIGAAVDAVLRWDPPIQNTRRFVHDDAVLCGQRVTNGESVLVVLAAANRDPTATDSHAFGAGPHRCPARLLAPTIARHAIAGAIRVAGGVPAVEVVGYRPSANARIPRFAMRR